MGLFTFEKLKTGILISFFFPVSQGVLAGVAVFFGKKSVNALESCHLPKKKINTQKNQPNLPWMKKCPTRLNCSPGHDRAQRAPSHGQPWGNPSACTGAPTTAPTTPEPRNAPGRRERYLCCQRTRGEVGGCGWSPWSVTKAESGDSHVGRGVGPCPPHEAR